MPSATIDRLIINSPYEEPGQHWQYDRETRLFALTEGRRPAGYVVASGKAGAFDDPGVFVAIPLVNQIRPRVKAWREAGWPGVTAATRRLLTHWTDPEEFETRRFFFCQLEAVETLIWLAETPDAAEERRHPGREEGDTFPPSDGGAFQRLCAKMATGSGKTIVMGMVIAWHVLNKVAAPQDPRFSAHVLITAPGLTVKSRLAVLNPSHPDNYYEAFRIVPSVLLDRLRQGKVLVRNWHALNWETEDAIARKRSVDRRGAKSNEAYARAVLGELAAARGLLVINDEAHHAWRAPAGTRLRGVARDSVEEATKWVGGLDRIHAARGILACYDFSATPFAPTGRQSAEEGLFGWIVSDFGLNDAIEAGLVKTPRVVIRDDAVLDARTYRSRLYHLYNDPEVKDDLNRPAGPEVPLPDLVLNGYALLGYDWRETARAWRRDGFATPPVMITVANRTETAARIKYAFDQRRIHIEELCDPRYTLHIDSKALEAAEAAEEPVAALGEGDGRRLSRKEQAELLRRQVDTVGQAGKPGERVHNVISVGMLSEGWDARTVTHIMGLRAFSSQLLCEQVVGRGLRRTSYEIDVDGRFKPEYVNIFGVPFTFLPHESGDGSPLPPESKPVVEPLADRAGFAIRWPHIIRIDHVLRPRLTLDWEAVPALELNASQTVQLAELAPTVDGKPDMSGIAAIELEYLAREFRTQRIIFEAAREVYDQMHKNWPGSKEVLLAQLVGLAQQFIRSGPIRLTPALFQQDALKRRLLITLNMTRLVQHIWEAIRFENTDRLVPVFDRDQPVRSTGDMAPWHTGKPWACTARSHINRCVHDGAWEASEAWELDNNPLVAAWVKNDHLGFEVCYVYRGVVGKYRPDFLIRLSAGTMLVLETKGRDSERERTKRRFLDEWVRAVNAHRGFGRWSWDVSTNPGDVKDILVRHARREGREA